MRIHLLFWPRNTGALPKDIRIVSYLCLIISLFHAYACLALFVPLSARYSFEKVYLFGLLQTNQIFWAGFASLIYGPIFYALGILLLRKYWMAWWLGITLSLDYIFRSYAYEKIGDHKAKSMFIFWGLIFLIWLMLKTDVFHPFHPLKMALCHLWKKLKG